MKINLLLFFFTFFYPFIGFSQIEADFNFQYSEYCINQSLNLENNSKNSKNYEWDFCIGDFENSPQGELYINNSSFKGVENIRIFYEGVFDSITYTFIGSSNGELYRMKNNTDFSLSPIFEPVIGSLISMNRPTDIDIVKINNNYYGYIVDINDSKLYEISFGENIGNSPNQIRDLGNFNSLNRPYGIKAVVNKDSLSLLISNFNANYLTLLKKKVNDSTFETYNIPTGHGSSSAIDLIKYNGIWLAAISYSSANIVKYINFGENLNNSPLHIYNISTPELINPTGNIFIKENGKLFSIISARTSGIFKVDFGEDINLPPSIVNYGSIGIMNNSSRGINLIKNKNSKWNGLIVQTQNTVNKIDFSNDCSTEIGMSAETSPTISYSAPGTYDITLTATDENGNSSSVTKQITVLDQQAPQINIQTDANLCLDNSKTFTAQNLTPSQSLTSHTWDFGDGTTTSGPEVTHQYTAPGTYKVRLSVEADGGCGNFIEKEVHIYEAPEPEFSFPTAVLCTNGAIVFENLTPGEYNEDITWLWDFGDGTTSTERSPSHVYTTGGTKTVTLTAAIPGCEASISHDIAITVGPSVNFNADNLCFGEMVRFTNLTTGDDITGYVWDFGNGESSTLENPTVTYDAAGVYEVSLTANNTSGCSNTFVKTVTIRDLPEVDFDHAMACSGSPTPFQDRSTIGDGNISSWFWDFGDGSTATEKNPTHVFAEAGTYEVKLIATSSYGCVDSTIQTVLVKAAPKADFTVEVGCPGTLSRFTDASIIPENDQIVGWVWVINSATFYSKNPEIPFSQSGAYEVKLTVNSSNGCSSTITKTIIIDPLPTPDFTVGNVCTGDKTVFTDISQGGGSDEIVDWHWQIGTITSNEQHPEVIFPQAENVSVRLTVTTARGCTASTQKVIKVNALPHAAFTVQKSFGAPPLQVNLKNNTSGAVSYQWLFGDPENSTSSEENPSFVYTTLGRYEAKLVATNAAGCNDTASVFIETLIPALDVALEQLNTYTTKGDMQIVLKIVNKGSITIDNMDITLDLGGQLTLKEQFSGSILAGESLNYPLGINILEKDIVKVPYICASISINNVEFVEDDKENNSACREVAEEFVLLTPYPNPINDLFHINFVMPEKAPVRLMLMDMLGKKVMDMELQATKVGYNEYSLDFSSLTAGSYVMKISHQNNIYLRKVMVK